jgi:hypothetical protein
MKADRCDEAVVKFRESQRLDPASGTALNIGYCEAKLGRIASAWLAYRQAHRLAQSQGKTQHEALAREQADKLEPEVPHLVVTIDRASGADVSVMLDGAVLGRDMWSVPIPLDPGEHRIERRGGQAEPWTKTITLARGERLTVDVPTSPGANPMPAAAPPAQNTEPKPVPPPVESQRGASSQRTWGFVVGGAGLAAFATGTALLVSARVKYDGAEDDCPPIGCNDDGFETREAARTQAFIGMGVGAAGIALTGVGLALVLLADDDSHGGERSALVVGSPETPWALGYRARY